MGNTGSESRDPVWADLSWDELACWAGGVTVARGRRYQADGSVVSLSRRADGALVARVAGGEMYNTVVTRVRTADGTRLHSGCSCPVGCSCKHAVAAVLEYLHRLEAGVCAPLNAGESGAENTAVWPRWADDSDLPARTGKGDAAAAIARYLEELPKDELVAMLLDIAEVDDALAERLRARAVVASGDIDAAIEAARREMERVTGEDVWYDYDERELHVPDYGLLCEQLESLCAAGHADVVLELGIELVKLANGQVEDAHDDQEGEASVAISECLESVWEAVGQSSLSPAGRIIWLYDVGEFDDYDLCGDAEAYAEEEVEPEVWSEVADALLARLAGPGSDGDAYECARDMERIARALDRAGRSVEALEFTLTQASRGHNVPAAVDRLVAAGRLEEAKALARQGIADKRHGNGHIAANLRHTLQQIAAQEGDAALAAALSADAFFSRLVRSAYIDLREVARDAGLWDGLRVIVFDAVERGVLARDMEGWPLPATGLELDRGHLAAHAPDLHLLTEMALVEGDPELVLAYFDRLAAARPAPYRPGLGAEVAAAVVDTQPDRAIAIWLSLAEDCISHTNQSGYAAAINHLRPVRRTLTALNREAEWDAILTDIRARHKRKRSFIPMLDTMRDGPIIGD